jgi:hypothetical protein
MRLLLATNHLGLGGSESYLLCVAEQLDRLGHEVAIYAPERGRGEAVAEERELRLISEAEFAGFDAALVQDGAVSYRIAERCPDVAQAFVAHSGIFDVQAPPQLDGAVGAVIVLNDRLERRMRQCATQPPLVRLRQPIDTQRFMPQGPLREVPRKALLLSNTPHDDRLRMLEAACAGAGIELDRMGGAAGQVTDVRTALVQVDIVIGYGRSVLEGMACGKAAFVYDWSGGDGWVSKESYEAIEGDGFSGRSGRKVLDADSLAAELGRYSATMGPVNRDLVIAHHRAERHAEQLVELIGEMVPVRPTSRESLREMGRLVRLEWRAQLDVLGLRRENTVAVQRLHELERSREELQVELEATAARVGEMEARGAAYVAELQLAYEGTLSWRLTAPLRWLGARLRTLRTR